MAIEHLFQMRVNRKARQPVTDPKLRKLFIPRHNALSSALLRFSSMCESTSTCPTEILPADEKDLETTRYLLAEALYYVTVILKAVKDNK